MKLVVKSNGREVEMSKEIFEKLTEDQKMSYDIISREDAPAPKDQVVTSKLDEKTDTKK